MPLMSSYGKSFADNGLSVNRYGGFHAVVISRKGEC